MTTLSPLLKQATPVQAASGRGVHLIDTAGRDYLDFTAGIGVTSTGHCHPKIVAAAQAQVATLIDSQYTTVMHEPLQHLVAELGKVLPPQLDSVFFANSGTKFRTGFASLMGGVHLAPFPSPLRYGWDEQTAVTFALNELDFILQTLTAPSDTAAFIIEPVLGEGGYIPAPASFLDGLRERADGYGILLILDEVQTGIGWTGKFWAHQHCDIAPDILITAKGIASGFPLSGIAASSAMMSKALPGSQGGTYGANAVACAAAVATLRVIEEDGVVANCAAMGARQRSGLKKVAAGTGRIAEVRGLGLMLATEFSTADGAPDPALAAAAQRIAVEEGLLLLTCGPWNNVVRMIPALVINAEEVDAGLAAWDRAVTRALGQN
ncbi:MAG: hypothetical protein JWN95_548 [Frankiales bacterium]|nr:hypothetical protein [Frankiales bacterium]